MGPKVKHASENFSRTNLLSDGDTEDSGVLSAQTHTSMISWAWKANDVAHRVFGNGMKGGQIRMCVHKILLMRLYLLKILLFLVRDPGVKL